MNYTKWKLHSRSLYDRTTELLRTPLQEMPRWVKAVTRFQTVKWPLRLPRSHSRPRRQVLNHGEEIIKSNMVLVMGGVTLCWMVWEIPMVWVMFIRAMKRHKVFVRVSIWTEGLDTWQRLYISNIPPTVSLEMFFWNYPSTFFFNFFLGLYRKWRC